ncbi:hypothetical protein VULLAG_LOCUS4780 [Vulpes lagopus]
MTSPSPPPSPRSRPPCLSESLSLDCPRPSACGRVCACAGLAPNKAGGPPLPPYRRVRILPPSLRRPGDWSVRSRPRGEGAEDGQTAGCAPPPLKGAALSSPPLRSMSEWDWGGKAAGSFFRRSHGEGDSRCESLGPLLPTFSFWGWVGSALARRGKSRGFKRAAGGRPLLATSWRKAGGNYATQRAAGAAPGMLGGRVPARPPPRRGPRAGRPPPPPPATAAAFGLRDAGAGAEGEGCFRAAFDAAAQRRGRGRCHRDSQDGITWDSGRRSGPKEDEHAENSSGRLARAGAFESDGKRQGAVPPDPPPPARPACPCVRRGGAPVRGPLQSTLKTSVCTSAHRRAKRSAGSDLQEILHFKAKQQNSPPENSAAWERQNPAGGWETAWRSPVALLWSSTTRILH